MQVGVLGAFSDCEGKIRDLGFQVHKHIFRIGVCTQPKPSGVFGCNTISCSCIRTNAQLESRVLNMRHSVLSTKPYFQPTDVLRVFKDLNSKDLQGLLWCWVGGKELISDLGQVSQHGAGKCAENTMTSLFHIYDRLYRSHTCPPNLWLFFRSVLPKFMC